MKKHKITVRKPAAVLIAVVICLMLSATALAFSGVLQGVFKDITDGRGAVVGTVYEQASDEIGMCVAVRGDVLTVRASFADPHAAPYNAAERLGIAAYRIVDANGKTVQEGAAASVAVADGQADIPVPLDGVAEGCYKMLVTAFVSEKKADQPLQITGSWEAAFTK